MLRPLFILGFILYQIPFSYTQILNPPQDIFYHNNCNEVMLCWSTPDQGTDSLLGYNIYKDDIYYSYTEDSCYLLTLEAGLYYLGVSAVYNTGESDIVPINIFLPAYEAPYGLEFSINDTGAVVLHWQPVTHSSEQNNEWLYYDYGINNSGIGTCDCFLWSSILFDSATIASYYDYYVTHVQFHSYAGSEESWYTVMVWEGDSGQHEIHEQRVGQHFIDKWNTIKLNTPLSLLNKKDLYFGLKTWAVASEYPLSFDDIIDAVVGYSDLIKLSYEDSWASISSFGFDLNWNIRVIATNDTADQSIFLGYRIYNNGEKINDLHVTDTSFVVPAEFLLDYNRFAVTANYIGCESDSAIFVYFPTRIEESSNADVSIFPNPSTGLVSIQAVKNIQQLMVYSPAGVLLSTNYLAGKDATIDLSELPPGFYILRIQMKDEVPVNKMLILN